MTIDSALIVAQFLKLQENKFLDDLKQRIEMSKVTLVENRKKIFQIRTQYSQLLAKKSSILLKKTLQERKVQKQQFNTSLFVKTSDLKEQQKPSKESNKIEIHSQVEQQDNNMNLSVNYYSSGSELTQSQNQADVEQVYSVIHGTPIINNSYTIAQTIELLPQLEEFTLSQVDMITKEIKSTNATINQFISKYNQDMEQIGSAIQDLYSKSQCIVSLHQSGVQEVNSSTHKYEI